MDTPDAEPEPMDVSEASEPGLTFSRAAFRLALAVGRPDHAEAAAVAARPRFYRMPWLVPTGTEPADPDPLP